MEIRHAAHGSHRHSLAKQIDGLRCLVQVDPHFAQRGELAVHVGRATELAAFPRVAIFVETVLFPDVFAGSNYHSDSLWQGPSL